MDFNADGEIDPEILARHQQQYDDLMNEIDGLESDEDDDPQPKPVPKKQAPPVQKKMKAEPEDEFTFPKENNDALNELERALGGKKNNFADLEAELDQLESDEDDGGDLGDHEQHAHAHNVPSKKPVQAEVKQQAQPKPQPQSQPQPQRIQEEPIVHKPQVTSSSVSKGGNVATSQASGGGGSTVKKQLPYPMRHFAGADVKKLIMMDEKFHGEDSLKTLALVNLELTEVIEPCLDSADVSSQAKTYLEEKKAKLEKIEGTLKAALKSGNPNTYLKLVEQMKTKNLTTAKQFQEHKATAELERVKKRLAVLVAEEKQHMGGSQGGSKADPQAAVMGAASKNAGTSQVSQTSQKKAAQPAQPTLADSIKAPKEDKEPTITASQIDNASEEELLEILRKRKNQYHNFASYIIKEMMKNFDDNEKTMKKKELDEKWAPLLKKALGFISSVESGEDIEGAKAFLKKELVEFTPTVFHGKSLEQRTQQIESMIQTINKCIEEEKAYIEKLKGTDNDKKIQIAEKTLSDYNQYIDYLKKANDNKWIPVPKIVLAKDPRTVQLVNKDIKGDSLFVQFKGLGNITPRSYWIRWTVDTPFGPQTFDSSFCDATSLKFNYSHTVKISDKDKIDQSIENKGLRIEICFKKLFLTNKKCEVTLPFAPFRKTNTIEENAKLRDDGLQLSYVMKVREPLLKHSRTEVTIIQAFKLFKPFDKDAVVQQTQAQPAQPKPVQKQQPQEEAKKEEAKPLGLFEKRKYPPLVLLKQANDPLAGVNASEYPAGLTAEYVLDPANPDLIDCLRVLEKMSEELEKARPLLAQEGRRADNRIVSDNWTKSLKKATILKSKFEEGEVDPNQYLEILKTSLERDKQLLQFYKSKGDADRQAFLTQKMVLTQAEYKELEEALAAGGEEEA